VQTLRAVTLHAATAYTDWATVQWPALSCVLYGLCTYTCAHVLASCTHALTRTIIALAVQMWNDKYTKHCNVNKMASQVSLYRF